MLRLMPHECRLTKHVSRTSRPQADEGHQASRVGTLAAQRVPSLRMAGGAFPGIDDASTPHAAGLELRLRRADQVARPPSGALADERRQGAGEPRPTG